MRPPDSLDKDGIIVYTHECKDDQIAYFKVDMNLIDISLENAYLENVLKMNDFNYLLYFQRFRIYLQIFPPWTRSQASSSRFFVYFICFRNNFFVVVGPQILSTLVSNRL